MPLSLTALRRQLREHIGIAGDDIQTLPDADTSEITGADTYLNRAYWELLDKFPFREKEIVGIFPTVVGTGYYQAPSPFEALQQLAVEDLTSKQHTTLRLVGKKEFEDKFVNLDEARGKPEIYMREDNGFRLGPTPDQIYTIKIRYWTTLADLSNSNTTSPIPQSWHEIILFGGVWRAFLGVSKDHPNAQAARAWQASLIKDLKPVESKELRDTAHMGLQAIGYGDRDI